MQRWTLENVDFEKPKNSLKKINSPRSLLALYILGYSPDDLHVIPFNNYLTIYPNLRTYSKELQQRNYEFYENKRLEKIKESRQKRIEIIEEKNINEGNF